MSEDQKESSLNIGDELANVLEDATSRANEPLDGEALRREGQGAFKLSEDILKNSQDLPEQENDNFGLKRYAEKKDGLQVALRISSPQLQKMGLLKMELQQFDPEVELGESLVLGGIPPHLFGTNLKPNVGFKTDRCLILTIPDPDNKYEYIEFEGSKPAHRENEETGAHEYKFAVGGPVKDIGERRAPKSMVYFFNAGGEFTKLMGVTALTAEQEKEQLFFKGAGTSYLKDPITKPDTALLKDVLNFTKAVV